MPDPYFYKKSSDVFGLNSGRAKPTLADIDGDGDLDAFVGNDFGNTVFYRNTGTASNANFTAEASNFGLTDVGYNASPSFADIDGDGDLDAFVGEFNGRTLFFRNTGTASSASFTAEISNFGLTHVAPDASPSFADIDGDGDLDAFVGNYFGNTVFYRNTGTASSASFTAEISNFGLTGVGYNASPSFADIDGDGDLDAFVGEFYGNTLFFRNTGTASIASFTAEASNFGLTDVGYRASPTLVDIDADGDFDAFVGNQNGYTLFFINNEAPTLGGTFMTAGLVNDNASIKPFSGVTVADADGNNVSLHITYTPANGTFTGVGLTGAAGNYTLSAATLLAVQNQLQALVFTPTPNQVVVGAAVVTTFTLTANDGNIDSLANATTVVTATSINDAPMGLASAVLAGGTEDTAYSVSAANLLAGFSDADGDSLAVANLVANHGNITNNNNGTFTLTPTEGVVKGRLFLL